LPQALGEIHAAAVGGQKEEEEPRIRIVERWPISEIIVSWFILCWPLVMEGSEDQGRKGKMRTVWETQ
jgi:hypothetical protein